MKWVHRILSSAGCTLLVVSVALDVVLDRTAVDEQALSPGEDSFGGRGAGHVVRAADPLDSVRWASVPPAWVVVPDRLPLPNPIA